MSRGPAEELFAYATPHDRCSECGREPRAGEDVLEDWRVESDEAGELYVFCPECWEREFGEDRLD